MRVMWLLLLVVVLGLGCFSPDVDVDTSGLRPALAHISTARSSRTSSSGSGSAVRSDRRVDGLEDDVAKLEKKVDDLEDDLEDDLAKLEKKLGDLKDDFKELKDRVKKLEKKLD